MKGVLILTLCGFTCFSQITCLSLTKEVPFTQNSDLQITHDTLENAFNFLSNGDVRKQVLNLIFESPEQGVANVVNLLNSKSNPQVEEVLDAFNAGLGYRLLVINDDYVQIDSDAFERLMSQNAMTLSRTLYPKDYFRQLIVFGTLEKKIKEISQQVRHAIASSKIPVEKFASALSSERHGVYKREIRERDFLSDMLQTVQFTLCDTLLATAYKQLNSTLYVYRSFLDNINISSSENFLGSVIELVVSTLVELAERTIVAFDGLAQSLSGSICHNLFSPNSTTSSNHTASNSTSQRTPRALTEVDYVLRVKRDTELSETVEGGLASRGLLDYIWGLIWGLVSSIANVLLTSLADSSISLLQRAIDALIQNILLWVHSVINSIFSV